MQAVINELYIMFKKFLCISICLVVGYATHIFAQKTTKVFIISDTHTMAPELLVEDGMAIQSEENRSQNLFRYSHEFLLAMKDTILQRKPDLVFIPGDLSKDAEYVSHQAIIGVLEQIRQQGIKVFVIPGNHDTNLIGHYFVGDMYLPAETTTGDQFVDLYQDFGYATAIERDKASLSYVCEPVEGLRLICIDSEDNYDTRFADGNEEQIHSFEKALEWILAKADEGCAAGKQVIAMMHHNILEHFDGQAEYMPSYFLQNGKNISQQFLKHGIHLVITGHTHLQDIAKNYNQERTDSIIDISTGSLLSFPCPFRELTFNEDFTVVDVKTGYLTHTESVEDVLARSQERLFANTLQRCPLYAVKFWSSFRRKLNQFASIFSALGVEVYRFPQTSDEFGELTTKYMGVPLAKASMIWYGGNEWKNPASATIEQEMKDSMLAMSVGMLGDETLGQMAFDYAMQSYYTETFQPIVNSALNDCTYYGTEYADITDDEQTTLTLPKPSLSAIRNISIYDQDNAYYTLDGRKVTSLKKGIYIHQGKKIVVQ